MKDKRYILSTVTFLLCLTSVVVYLLDEKKLRIAMVLIIGAMISFIVTAYQTKEDGEALKNKMLWSFNQLSTIMLFFGAYTERTYGELHKISLVILIIVFFVNLLTTTVIFFLRPETKSYKYIILILFELQFIICILTMETPWIMYVPFPLVVTYLLFKDYKIISVANAITSTFNILAVFKFIDKLHMLEEIEYLNSAYFVQVWFVILFTVALCVTLKLNNEFQQEKLAHLAKANDKSYELSREIISIVEKIKNNAVDTKNVITKLEEATVNSLDLLRDVEVGNHENEECINSQNDMTDNIVNMIESVKKESDLALDSTKESIIGLGKSKSAFDVLKQKSDVIDEKNRRVINIINEFVDNAKKVKNITNGIAEISEQTNLLALNASIESARAGERGKDFMVVASEISGLADNTSNLTDNISKIVLNLEHNALKAQEVVSRVVKSVELENVTIEDTRNDIIIMEQDVKTLSDNVKIILDKIQSMAFYNIEITKNIEKLVGSNTKVKMYTTQALELNNDNIKKVTKTIEYMNELLEVAKI